VVIKKNGTNKIYYYLSHTATNHMIYSLFESQKRGDFISIILI
jgi:hypothetical protein